MRLKLDENLGELGRAALSAAGHDVSTVSEQAMGGADDRQLYDVCLVEKRVLVTLDHDFGEVLRFPPEPTAGIVVLECRGRLTPKAIEDRVAEFIVAASEQDVAGQLWIVEPGRIRMREK